LWQDRLGVDGNKDRHAGRSQSPVGSGYLIRLKRSGEKTEAADALRRLYGDRSPCLESVPFTGRQEAVVI
jgi:hypothetical protein